MMINAESYKIDLTAKDLEGETGFQLAKGSGKMDIVNIMKRKMPKIAF